MASNFVDRLSNPSSELRKKLAAATITDWFSKTKLAYRLPGVGVASLMAELPHNNFSVRDAYYDALLQLGLVEKKNVSPHEYADCFLSDPKTPLTNADIHTDAAKVITFSPTGIEKLMAAGVKNEMLWANTPSEGKFASAARKA